MPGYKEDIFGRDAWNLAGDAIDFGYGSAILPIQLQARLIEERLTISPDNRIVTVDDSRILQLEPGEIVGHRCEEESLDDEPEEPEEPLDPEDDFRRDENGLFFAELGALQSAITVVVADRLRQAYVLGRLDALADMEGSNARRFVRARELGRIAEDACMHPVSSERSSIDQRIGNILGAAIYNYGSLTEAVKVPKQGKQSQTAIDKA